MGTAETPKYENYKAYITINYHLNLHDYEQAEKTIDAYLESHPDDPFILTEKAFILENIKNEHKQALKYLKKAMASYPEYYYSNYLYASILYLSHKSEINISDISTDSLQDEAIKHLEISVKDNPDNYDSQLLAGIILSDKGEYEKSNSYLSQSIDLKPYSEAYFYMAYNYKQLKNTKAELETYKKVLSIGPYNYRALSYLSRYYLGKKEFKKAAPYLEKLFSRNPEDKKKVFDYLYALFAAGENDKFLAVTENIDISDFPFLIYARALFLSQSQRFDDALKQLDMVKEKDFKTNILLANIYRTKQDYFKAYQILEEIDTKERNHFYYTQFIEILYLLDMNNRILQLFDEIKSNADILENFSLWEYYNVIFAHMKLEKYQPLKSALAKMKEKLTKKNGLLQVTEIANALDTVLANQKVTAKEIKFDSNRYLVIEYFKKQKKYDEVTAFVREIITGEAKSDVEKTPEYYLELCDIFNRLEKTTEVDELLKQMNTLFPDSPEVKNYHAYYLAERSLRLELALDLSKHTLDSDGNNLAYIDTYGYVLLKLGRTSEAADFLKKAYDKHPFEPEIIQHLADYYRTTDNTAKIIEIYQRAIDHGVDFKPELLKKIKDIKKEHEKEKTPHAQQ
ncbi:MAG: tetratricopeptide repeat protein [bacterium]|nr:tetratricopeptide repeat protein [bacterium]